MNKNEIHEHGDVLPSYYMDEEFFSTTFPPQYDDPSGLHSASHSISTVSSLSCPLSSRSSYSYCSSISSTSSKPCSNSRHTSISEINDDVKISIDFKQQDATYRNNDIVAGSITIKNKDKYSYKKFNKFLVNLKGVYKQFNALDASLLKEEEFLSILDIHASWSSSSIINENLVKSNQCLDEQSTESCNTSSHGLPMDKLLKPSLKYTKNFNFKLPNYLISDDLNLNKLPPSYTSTKNTVAYSIEVSFLNDENKTIKTTSSIFNFRPLYTESNSVDNVYDLSCANQFKSIINSLHQEISLVERYRSRLRHPRSHLLDHDQDNQQESLCELSSEKSHQLYQKQEYDFNYNDILKEKDRDRERKSETEYQIIDKEEKFDSILAYKKHKRKKKFFFKQEEFNFDTINIIGKLNRKIDLIKDKNIYFDLRFKINEKDKPNIDISNLKFKLQLSCITFQSNINIPIKLTPDFLLKRNDSNHNINYSKKIDSIINTLKKLSKETIFKENPEANLSNYNYLNLLSLNNLNIKREIVKTFPINPISHSNWELDINSNSWENNCSIDLDIDLVHLYPSFQFKYFGKLFYFDLLVSFENDLDIGYTDIIIPVEFN